MDDQTVTIESDRVDTLKGGWGWFVSIVSIGIGSLGATIGIPFWKSRYRR